MGRKVLRPNLDNLVELIDENLSPEVNIEFIQNFLHVDPPKEMVLKLAKTEQKQKQLLEFLQRNLEENPA